MMDFELLFFLVLTFGLEEELFVVFEWMVGFVEVIGGDHGVVDPLQMMIGVSNGERLYAVRYASGM